MSSRASALAAQGAVKAGRGVQRQAGEGSRDCDRCPSPLLPSRCARYSLAHRHRSPCLVDPVRGVLAHRRCLDSGYDEVRLCPHPPSTVSASERSVCETTKLHRVDSDALVVIVADFVVVSRQSGDRLARALASCEEEDCFWLLTEKGKSVSHLNRRRRAPRPLPAHRGLRLVLHALPTSSSKAIVDLVAS